MPVSAPSAASRWPDSVLDQGPAPSDLRRRLMRWYDRTHRDLPWRRVPHDAYRQWLAECMLQQTQVATALPYYQKFTKRYPSVERLAAAPLDDVLQLWAGLGYYARARNLHAAARTVLSEHGGRFPDTVEGLMALPGIGRYTAGAIASIAFGRRAPVLDGNVKRVLARLFAIDAPMDQPQTLRNMWQLARDLLPRKRCGDFNQALMELGAVCCTPRQPQCAACPLSQVCAAYCRGCTQDLPRRVRRRTPQALNMVAVAIEHHGHYALRRRPPGGLWGGLWELPCGDRQAHDSAQQAVQVLLRDITRQGHDIAVPARATGTVHHQLTHRTLRLSVFTCKSTATRRPMRRTEHLRWVAPKDFGAFALGSAQRKVIQAAGLSGDPGAA